MELPRHPLVNKFFYRFYNEHMEDQAVVELVGESMYLYVAHEIDNYTKNKQHMNMDYNQFAAHLNARLTRDRAEEVAQLKAAVNQYHEKK